MFKHWCIFLLYLSLNAAVSHESVELSTLVPLQSFPNNGISLAISLPIEDLKNVSNSVLEAEKWLKDNVLAHYPATNITTILVGNTLLCKKNQENSVSLILPSIKNIYYSLTRWGLENEIKVTTTFSSKCLDQDSRKYNIKHVLDCIQHVNAPYVVSLNSVFDEKIETLVKKLGKLSLNKIFLNQEKGVQEKGKFSFFDTFPTKPTSPLAQKYVSTYVVSSKYTFPTKPTTTTNPVRSHGWGLETFPTKPATTNSVRSHGWDLGTFRTTTTTNRVIFHGRGLGTFPTTPVASPAFAANSPLPPLIGNISPPPFSPPEMPPLFDPISPSYGPHLPPCIPSHGGVSGPAAGPVGKPNGLWCVAKPSVPPETLQEALDYACGEGGADCEAIGPTGSCFYPDTVVAHASYAFNSYWQKTKSNGGSCGFGGTAMLINSDPSYRHCRFILA